MCACVYLWHWIDVESGPLQFFHRSIQFHSQWEKELHYVIQSNQFHKMEFIHFQISIARSKSNNVCLRAYTRVSFEFSFRAYRLKFHSHSCRFGFRLDLISHHIFSSIFSLFFILFIIWSSHSCNQQLVQASCCFRMRHVYLENEKWTKAVKYIYHKWSVITEHSCNKRFWGKSIHFIQNHYNFEIVSFSLNWLHFRWLRSWFV